MSFILDALRKSEARRQQSGTPGLNSPEPPRPPRRRRRRLLPFLALALAVFCLAATAVYLAGPEWLPQRLVGGPDISESGEENTSDSPPKAAQLAQQDDADDAPRRQHIRRQPPTSESAAEAGEKPQAKSSVRDRRAPIPADPDRVVRREAPQRESAPIPAVEAAEELERRIAEEERRRRSEPVQVPEEPASSRRREDNQSSSIQRKPDTEPAPLNTGVAEYLRRWELPFSVRRSLPEMNLSIHVFSPVEEERFVLINGERYGPGDAIGEAKIVDIIRDGAVVDFRSHRFLLEPR